MLKLYAVLLGGRAKGCHIELHDVVFIVSPSLEEAYPRLVHKWFGTHKRLHIDSSVELSLIDGHEIILSKEKPNESEQNNLFFVNFGGYTPGVFGELHEVGFYVAPSKALAVAKAKEHLCVNSHQQHADDNLSVAEILSEDFAMPDDILSINKVDNYYIHLKPTTQAAQLEITSHYRRLDVPEIMGKANQIMALNE